MTELGERPKRKRSRCSRATCTTCCWPRRPARARDGPRPRHPHRRARWPWSIATGKVLAHRHRLSARAAQRLGGAQAELAAAGRQHTVDLIAIGNGTASRETERLVADMLSAAARRRRPTKVVVSEAGASVYSASESRARSSPTST